MASLAEFHCSLIIRALQVRSDELFAIRECNRNNQPDQGVCDIWHTVHSDELFSIREHNRNGST